MQLVKSRPISLPVFKSGCWFDDFAVTGANDPGYALNMSSLKEPLPYGIRLRAKPEGKPANMVIPIKYSYSDFKAEIKTKYGAGSCNVFIFRLGDTNNRWMLQMVNNTSLSLLKVSSSVYTNVGSISDSFSNMRTIGISAIGPNIDIFLDHRKIISVTDVANINNKIMQLDAYSETLGLAYGEWQYLAVKPL